MLTTQGASTTVGCVGTHVQEDTQGMKAAVVRCLTSQLFAFACTACLQSPAGVLSHWEPTAALKKTAKPHVASVAHGVSPPPALYNCRVRLPPHTRSCVWSEPSVVDAAAYEFAETAKFLDTGEQPSCSSACHPVAASWGCQWLLIRKCQSERTAAPAVVRRASHHIHAPSTRVRRKSLLNSFWPAGCVCSCSRGVGRPLRVGQVRPAGAATLLPLR